MTVTTSSITAAPTVRSLAATDAGQGTALPRSARPIS